MIVINRCIFFFFFFFSSRRRHTRFDCDWSSDVCSSDLIVVNNNSPVASLQELIAFARANPGKLFNASAGYGSAPHLAAVLFESVAGVKFTSVQFKGGGPAAQSLLAGDTQVMFATSPTVMGFVRSGRLRALAVSMRDGSPAVPGIPGSAQAGLPAYDYTC